MNIVVDENMPYARELFSRLGEVVAVPGRPLPQQALRGAQALMVRSVTPVNAALRQSADQPLDAAGKDFAQGEAAQAQDEG